MRISLCLLSLIFLSGCASTDHSRWLQQNGLPFVAPDGSYTAQPPADWLDNFAGFRKGPLQRAQGGACKAPMTRCLAVMLRKTKGRGASIT